MPFSPWKKPQACLRPRDRFWDIPVPKIDSAFDNLLVPQPSWSPSTTQQLRKLVAAPYLAPNDWTPRSEAYFVFPLAQGTPGKQCGLAATGVYQPSLRSPWLAANDAFLQVRACARRIEALTKQRTQAKNQLHALQATDTTPSFILEDVQLSITQADHQIDTLRKRTLQLIEANETMQQVLALLLSVKGIAEASAIQLMGELLVLPEDMKAKQWVAMAGLDPKHHQSGSSINKKARISKVGNRYLRQALYMPALSAARHDKHVNGYYRHLIE
ncbi:transposase, partial [Thiolapillus sp.]